MCALVAVTILGFAVGWYWRGRREARRRRRGPLDYYRDFIRIQSGCE